MPVRPLGLVLKAMLSVATDVGLRDSLTLIMEDLEFAAPEAVRWYWRTAQIAVAKLTRGMTAAEIDSSLSEGDVWAVLIWTDDLSYKGYIEGHRG